jgi:branched-chain amino acid transport system substrate-binding protein
LKYFARLRRCGFYGLSILLLLVLGACASAEQHAANDIPIAVAGPMSGDLAEFGTQMREAAKLAVADINAAGGVLGKPLRLVIQDDECDPGRARSVARKIVAQDVVAVIGHFCSGVSIPASEVYANNNVLQITPASNNPMLTEQAAAKGWHTVFRTCTRDDYQGVVAADYLAEHYGQGRIAVLRDDSNYGATVEKPLLRRLASHGIDPVYRGQISAGRSSYQRRIDELIDARPDVIYFSGYHPEAALLVKEARASGLQAAFFGADALMTLEFATLAGQAADGVMFTGNLDLGQMPEAADLVRRLREQGLDVASYSIFTYAAIQEFALAAQRAGTTDAEAVAQVLRSDSFDTVMGRVTFDKKGDLREAAYSWYRFENGDYRVVP